MISRYTTRQGLTWIDLESPTIEEVHSLAEEYSLHPVITQELLARSERGKVDLYENAIYLTLHFPLRNRTTGNIDETEIDFVLLKNALITTHYELVDPLHDFAKLFEVDSYLSNVRLGEHAGYLFFSQIRELYKHTIFILESTERDIREIEKEIFCGEEAKMVTRVSKTNRSLIDIRSSLRSHKETIKSFSEACARVFEKDFSYYVSVIEGEFSHISQIVEESRQTLQDLRQTNDSLLSNKTNMTIKRLTIITVIFMQLQLIAVVFAMHSRYLYLDEPWQLFSVLGGMVILTLISIQYFRFKKWL